jgi:hypothetical protein
MSEKIKYDPTEDLSEEQIALHDQLMNANIGDLPNDLQKFIREETSHIFAYDNMLANIVAIWVTMKIQSK